MRDFIGCDGRSGFDPFPGEVDALSFAQESAPRLRPLLRRPLAVCLDYRMEQRARPRAA